MIALAGILLIQFFIILYMTKREESRRDYYRQRKVDQLEQLMNILQNKHQDEKQPHQDKS